MDHHGGRIREFDMYLHDSTIINHKSSYLIINQIHKTLLTNHANELLKFEIDSINLPAKPSVKPSLTTSTPMVESHCKSTMHATTMKKNVPMHSATTLRQNSAEQYHPRSVDCLPPARRRDDDPGVVFRLDVVELRKSYEVWAIFFVGINRLI